MKRYLKKAMGWRVEPFVRLLAVAVCAAVAAHSATAATLLVSEYGSGNIRAFDPATGAETTLPAHYSPVGGNSSGADGMVLDPDGRLLVNRGDGTIFRRSADGNSFAQFADTGAEYLLDGARTSTHLFAAQFGENLIWRIALSNAAVSSIAGPPAANRFDGVRIGPDGRLYAVDSQNGNLFAYNLTSSSWSTFLTNPLAGEASQIEFGADGRVFLSRTIGGQARIYSYTLNTPGDYSSGLNPSSQTLIGSYGSFGAATGIRIGPDGRLYANAFNAGEVWRSTIGITAMEGTAFVSGLQEPGSIFFEADDDPPALPGVLVDFGRDVLTVASPDANGRWWNNVATDDALPPSGSFSNLVNATNGMTAIAISVSGFGAGANTNGATSPDAALGDLAIANATRDSFFVASGNTATVTFSGLEPARLYRLECFGSRDAADSRSTRFTAAGLSSTSATVQTSGTGIGLAPEVNANRAGLAVIEEVQPTALGGIVLSVAGRFRLLRLSRRAAPRAAGRSRNRQFSAHGRQRPVDRRASRRPDARRALRLRRCQRRSGRRLPHRMAARCPALHQCRDAPKRNHPRVPSLRPARRLPPRGGHPARGRRRIARRHRLLGLEGARRRLQRPDRFPRRQQLHPLGRHPRPTPAARRRRRPPPRPRRAARRRHGAPLSLEPRTLRRHPHARHPRARRTRHRLLGRAGPPTHEPRMAVRPDRRFPRPCRSLRPARRRPRHARLPLQLLALSQRSPARAGRHRRRLRSRPRRAGVQRRRCRDPARRRRLPLRRRTGRHRRAGGFCPRRPLPGRLPPQRRGLLPERPRPLRRPPPRVAGRPHPPRHVLRLQQRRLPSGSMRTAPPHSSKSPGTPPANIRNPASPAAASTPGRKRSPKAAAASSTNATATACPTSSAGRSASAPATTTISSAC
jgi:hypothetical protein